MKHKIFASAGIILISFLIVESLFWGFIYLTVPEINPNCVGCSQEERAFHFELWGMIGSVITAIVIVPILSSNIYWRYSKKKSTSSEIVLMVISSAIISYLLLALIYRTTDFPTY